MKQQIIIKMDAQDFERLSNTSMGWLHGRWQDQINEGRFESPHICELAKKMEWAYWFDNPVAFIMAKSYLSTKRISFFATEDLWLGESVIFTDYMGAKEVANV